MEKTLEKRQETKLSTEVMSDWGTENVDNKDILIPKLLVMQGLSKFVTEEKAMLGDFCNSVSSEVIGTARGEKEKQKPVAFVPIMTFKTWVQYKLIDGKRQYWNVIEHTPQNSNLPLKGITKDEFGIDTEVERDECINFYVLLADQPDALPYVLSFRRTSKRAGKILSTYFKECQIATARGKPTPPAANIFNLCAQKVTNDKGTFYVLEVTRAGKTPEQTLLRAWEWYKTLRASTVKVDDSDLTSAEEVAPVEDDRF